MFHPRLASVTMLLICAGTTVAGSPPVFQDVRIVQSLPPFNPAFPGASGVERIKLRAIDVNNDDAPDLVTWVAGIVTVQLNRGDATFDPPLTIASGALDADVADLDDDGDPDIALALGGSINVFANDSLGSFSPVASIAVAASRITPADANSDGRTDLIASNQLLLRNPGPFQFQPPLATPIGPNFLPARLSPTTPDIDFIELDSGALLYSLGGGVVVPAGSATNPLPAIGIANFDADSDDDVLRSANNILDSGVRAAGVNLNINGMFQALPDTERVRTHMMRSMAVGGDFNADARTDVVAAPAIEFNNQEGPGRRFHAWMQAPDTSLPLAATRTIGGYFPAAMATADFNRDSIMDVAFACSGNSISTVIPGQPSSIRSVGRITAIALGSSKLAFASIPQDLFVMRTNARISSLEVTDINADGHPDILACDGGSRLETRLNRGDATFSDLSVFTQVPGNVLLRLLTKTSGSGAYIQSNNTWRRLRFDPSVYPANCPTCANDYLPGLGLDTDPSPIPSGLNADLDADGDLDALRITSRGNVLNSSSVTAFMQQPSGPAVQLPPVTVPGRADTLRIASFTDDNIADVLVLTNSPAQPTAAPAGVAGGAGLPEAGGVSGLDPAPATSLAREDAIELLQNDGAGHLVPAGRIAIQENQSTRRGFDVVVGDVNADSRDDLVVIIAATNTLSVFHGQKGGGFGPRIDHALPWTPNFDNEGGDTGPILADIDSDTDLDVILFSSAVPGQACQACSAERVAFLFNDGNGKFATSATGPYVGHAQSIIRVADINNDTRPDLVVGGLHGVVVSLNTTPAPNLVARPVNGAPRVRQINAP